MKINCSLMLLHDYFNKEWNYHFCLTKSKMQKWGMAETYQGVISQIIPCIVSQLTVFILHFLLQNSTILADLSRMLMDSL